MSQSKLNIHVADTNRGKIRQFQLILIGRENGEEVFEAVTKRNAKPKQRVVDSTLSENYFKTNMQLMQSAEN